MRKKSLSICAGLRILALTALLAPSCRAVVYVKPDSPAPIPDGASWATAFHSVQAGLDAANPAGDEVWVARGTYPERITLKINVAVYGGFEGTESSRDQRNLRLNPTVVDGGGSDAAVTGEDSSSIDGFIIRNADFGVLCSERSPTVANNRIVGHINGVYCTRASPVIVNNVIAGNERGINCDLDASAAITNNTVIGNGIGLRCAYSAPTAANNILAFGEVGVLSESGAPSLFNNDVYGNADDYVGASPGTGDISADPVFASLRLGNLRIQPTSPCRNAGTISAPGILDSDMDGGPRIVGGFPDIGAHESDGRPVFEIPRVIYVNASAPPNGDGRSWAGAHRTIQAAADDASTRGAEIWIAQGTYIECVKLPPFAHLYGGFAGAENSRSLRNPSVNLSVIDAGMIGCAVTAPSFSTLDGLTIRNAFEGIRCSSGSPTISNNAFTGNLSGVMCILAGPSIAVNSFSGNDCAIYCDLGSPAIANNTITGSAFEGVYSWSASPRIANNAVSDNPGRGFLFAGGEPSLANSIIAFNGVGVSGIETGAALSHNDVYSNDADYDGVLPGAGDISADPLFANRPGGDFHLSDDSPCINAGDNLAAGIPSCDMDGEPRIVNGAVDIGPDERWYSRPSASADAASYRTRGSAVTAVFGDSFYIESDDRSWGIRVQRPSHGLAAGMRADVTGVLRTDSDGARYIEATSASPAGTGVIQPLFMPCRALGGGNWRYDPLTGAGQKGVLGGTGLNNIGLLISIAGRVTYSCADFFYVDDGSRLDDGSGHPGVKIRASGLNPPLAGSFVRITGISSCFKDGALLHPLLVPRSQDDIAPQ